MTRDEFEHKYGKYAKPVEDMTGAELIQELLSYQEKKDMNAIERLLSNIKEKFPKKDNGGLDSGNGR